MHVTRHKGLPQERATKVCRAARGMGTIVRGRAAARLALLLAPDGATMLCRIPGGPFTPPGVHDVPPATPLPIRQRILELHTAGQLSPQTADLLAIPQRTVRHLLARWRTAPPSLGPT